MASPSSFRQMLGVPPSTASVKDSTLIIIDAQNEYAEGKLQVSNVSTSRKVIASLLEKYRQGGGNVVHVVHATPDGAPVFTPNTKLAEEFEELTPRAGEKIVHKNYPSSFASTDLEQHLQSISSKKIVLTGYMVSWNLPRDCISFTHQRIIGPCLRFHHCSTWCTARVRCHFGRGCHWRQRCPRRERGATCKGCYGRDW